jgi:VanZ family protein
LFALFLAIVCLIVYGSLYPLSFQFIRMPASPLWILLHAWGATHDRRFYADLLINLALYVPLGVSGYLALRRNRIAGPVLVGAAVSAGVEMLQLYTTTRVCSGFDLAMNTVGSALGVGLGMLLESLAGPELAELGKRKVADRRALLLLLCWAGSLLFPLYPEMHLSRLRADIALFAQSPVLAPVPFLLAAVSWFVAGRLLRAAGFRYAEAWLALSLLMLPAQFLIVLRQPAPVDCLGALTGFVLFLALGAGRVFSAAAARMLAGVFLGVLLVRGLSPYQLSEGFPPGGWQTVVEMLLERTFWYGAAVWLLQVCGLRLRQAGAVVVILLALMEVAHTQLPGRAAEVTEPLLGLLAVGFLAAVSPRRQSDGAPLPLVQR